jgi:replication factor A1
MLLISDMVFVQQLSAPMGAARPAPVAAPQPNYGAPAPQGYSAPMQQNYGAPQPNYAAPAMQQNLYGNPYSPNPTPMGGGMPSAYGQQQPSFPAPAYGAQTNQYGQTLPPNAPNYGGYGAPQQQAPPQAVSNPYANPSYGGSYSASTNSRPVVREDNLEQAVIPISGLNPYANKWTIKARITNKSPIRTWSNAKGNGQLFSIDLVDNQGTEIRGTFFNDAATKWFGVLEEGQVYLLSGGKIKLVQNKQYTHIKNNYELSFDANSDIRPCVNDGTIKTQPYKFVSIANLPTVDPNELVDIIGVVKSFGDVAEISIKSQGGKMTQKRELTIIDTSNMEVRLTLWGEKAQNPGYQWNDSPIVAFRAVKVSDYGGRSLGSTSNTSIAFDPQVPEYQEIYRWRSMGIPEGISVSSGSAGAGGDRSGVNEAIENRYTIAQLKEDGLGLGDKADFVVVKGTVNYIKHDNDPWYTACPTCNKKVSQAHAGWYCEKCGKSYETPERRYILSCTFADHTGNAWFSIFSEEATKLLGVDANQLHAMKEQGDVDGYDSVFSRASFETVIAKVRVKQEDVNGEKRMKNTVVSLSKVDFANEAKLMLDALNKYQ